MITVIEAAIGYQTPSSGFGDERQAAHLPKQTTAAQSKTEDKIRSGDLVYA